MDFIGHIRPININEEMRSSYLDYAMSVIVARALPDARDGLKPVHRRILYAMYEMGMRANTSYKKSARIVGEVLGKYHPHGDSAVYDAMARMAQEFSLRYPLVDGQGNFGSVDGDSPAAMRYTEARLARIAEEMLVDIDMNTVDFSDNYDGTQQEPTVLPARLPNMLLNGASGIAVGMATNIPPHNLRELAEAIVYLIDRWETIDEVTVDELIQFVKGPDFPTGAQVIANEALKEAYATGRGHIFVRARIENEVGKNDRHRLIITEIPYQISKTAVIERIVALVKEDKVTQVADLRDESDRDGMRLVVELKNGANPDTARKQLLKYTQLQSTYGIQMLALVNGEPRTLSLKRMLQIYVEHRYEIIVRRSQFELEKRRARAHILEGLLKALSSLDAIIQTIRSADDVDDARTKLVGRFGLSEAQSNAILEMQLRRLAALEQLKLQQEYAEVSARIAYLEELLASPARILAVIREDIVQLAATYGDARRTDIIYGENVELSDYDLIKKEEVIVLMTRHGYIKRVPATAYKAQRRGGKGVIGMATKEEDALCDVLAASSHDTLLFFSDKGKVYSTPAFNVPEAGRASKGTLVHSVIAIGSDEKVTAIVPVDSFDKQGYFVLATRNGRIKRVELEEFAEVRPSGLIAISLEDGDRLQWANYTDGDQDVMIVTSQGRSIRFHERHVRAMGRQAGGVRSIRLYNDDTVAGMDVIEADDTHMLVVTQNGYGKRTLLDAYREQGRFGMGMRTLARDERTGPIVKMCCIKASDDILIMTRDGAVLRTQLEQIREVGRSAIGVRLIHLDRGDHVVGIAIMVASDLTNGVYLSDSEMEAMTMEAAPLDEADLVGDEPDDDILVDDAAIADDEVVDDDIIDDVDETA